MEKLTSLEDMTTGRYQITTSSGTVHLLDLDQSTVTRQGTKGHEWEPGRDMGYGPVTGDGTPFHFLFMAPIQVGESMFFESLTQWRISTPVVSIEKDEPENAIHE